MRDFGLILIGEFVALVMVGVWQVYGLELQRIMSQSDPVVVVADDPSMPVYDVKAICAQRHEMISETFCTNFEYLMRKQAAELWPRASAAVRKECGRWQDYQALDGCLEAHYRPH